MNNTIFDDVFRTMIENMPDYLEADVVFPDENTYVYSIPTIKMSDYTKDSWKSFSDALTSAEELLKNSDATQDMLDASLLDLQTAYENLVKTDDQNGNDNNGNNNNGDNNNGNNNNGNNNNGNNNNGNNSGNNNANNNNNSSNKANTSAPSAKTGDITTFAPIALLLAASLSVIAFITKRRRSA